MTMSRPSYYYSITGNSEAIYVGGWVEDDKLRQFGTDNAVITRINIDTLTVNWMMLYRENSDSNLELVTGLALNPDGSKLAVVVYN